jgi:hypothetical protein
MDLDTFHNHADTLPSGFKVLTEEDLKRMDQERAPARRKRWITVGLVALLAFLGCLAGTGYASTVLGSSAPAPTHAAKAPVHHVAKSHSPGKAVKPTLGPTAMAPVPVAPAPQAPLPVLTVGGYSGTEPQLIDYSGDGGNVVTGIVWQYWNATGAYGVGTSDIQGCVPDCVTGTNTPVTTTITLSNVVDGNFQTVTESRDGQTSTGMPQAAQQFDNTSQIANPNQAYLVALANAGINAPGGWSVQTAQSLETAWANGETEDQTNAQYLTPGGIYPEHLAAFNSIVHQYFG